MNRFINALLIFIFLPTLLLTIYVGLDLPLSMLKTTGAELPHREIFFLSSGLIILMINIRRSIRRWMGMRVVTRTEKFKWNHKVSRERFKRVNTYLALEMMVMATVGSALFILTPEAWLPAVGFLFTAVDNLLFMIVGGNGKRFRVGLSSKALIVADRDVVLLYFTGLRKVSIQQQTIYFDYIKGLQLSFPSDCIPEELREEFFQTLEDQLDKDKVYFSMKR